EPARYRWTESQATQTVARRAHRLYHSYLTLSLSRRVLEKNPDMTFRVHCLRRLFPDARFLFLVRDGEQTVASINHWSRRNRRQTQAVEDWWGVDNYKWQLLLHEILPSEPLLAHLQAELQQEQAEINKAAVEWIVTVQEGLRLLHEFPEQVMLLPYEKLVQSPAETLAAICGFCALAKDQTFLTYGQQALQNNRLYPAVELADYLQPAFRETVKNLEDIQQ
ncbi:MAG: sulfotransferase, partial [Anaerolineales bacterium]|nr:sulfotransferase [Anaerolineales bacterium]